MSLSWLADCWGVMFGPFQSLVSLVRVRLFRKPEWFLRLLDCDDLDILAGVFYSDVGWCVRDC